MNREKVKYQYRLGDDAWSYLSYSHSKEYSSLHEGVYNFEVRAVFSDGEMLNDSYNFIIKSPWYRTVEAYSFYLFLFLFFVWLIYKWDDWRLKQKELLVVKNKDIQMNLLKKEYKEEQVRKEQQIINLEKERLETELKHKSQEVANGIINLARRNELLMDIKTNLREVVNAMSGEKSKVYKKMLLIINSKIDSNIQSDAVLKKVEEQFDLIHNNFMKRLLAKYPNLSKNERMMCAYIMMNLSTKEMAPLLNISVRGVETIRYRLRKKFCLNRGDSLLDYLSHKL